jgi:predicted methyltransferase
MRSRFGRRARIMAVAFAASAIAFGAIAFAAGGQAHDGSAAIAAAVADSSRPDSDTTRDAGRKPGQTLVFIGIQPADNVADSGYFTRLFSSVVGSKGHVYAVEIGGSARILPRSTRPWEIQNRSSFSGNAKATGLQPFTDFDHDLNDEFMGPVEKQSRSLRATVRREVEAEVFKFDSESSILANPADPRTARVLDKSIRGQGPIHPEVPQAYVMRIARRPQHR